MAKPDKKEITAILAFGKPKDEEATSGEASSMGARIMAALKNKDADGLEDAIRSIVDECMGEE